MKATGWFRFRAVTVGVCVSAILPPSDGFAQWPGWGGKNRDFTADAKDLASSWPKDGPKKLWSRPLGAGYSSISADGDQLYTMYREGDDEIVVAMNANSGKTVWEHKYPAPVPKGMDPQFGKGPNATPQIHEGKIYTFGVGGMLQCIDQKSGKKLWSHDVVTEFSAKVPEFGFSPSPIVYKNSLILPVGGAGVGVMAFDLATGAVRWKKHDFVNTYSSPIVVNVGGKDELILLAGSETVGMDPANGDIEWRYPFETQYKTNIMTPLYGPDGILFISSAPEVGSRGLKLSRKDGKVNVEEVWSTKKMQVGQGTAARVGNVIYAPNGNETLFFMTAVDAGTGQVLWRERGFGKAQVIYADGKIIALEEDGNLSINKATPEKFELGSKAQLFKKSAWSTPTLVGKKLFVRDNEVIMALDLSAGGPT